jgi:putative acetyltransferase
MSFAISADALTIQRADLDSREARRLIGELNCELAAMYPEPGATHFKLEVAEVAPENGAFLIGFLAGVPVACGALRRIDSGVAEVKRMYVMPAARGRGLSKAMLAALEQQARQLGFARLVLETGTRQFEALALYRGAGFNSIARFGEYVGSELSVCMAKDLT